MPTTRLLPAAAGTDQAWSNGAGTVPTNVSTDDGDTTYRTTASASSVPDTFFADALPVQATIVNTVDAAVKGRRSAGGTTRMNARWRLGGTALNGAIQIDSASYTLATEVAVARPGGGAWVKTDFPGGGAGAECGYITTNTGVADTMRSTWAYFDVAWTPAAGGFFYLLGCWLPPLLAVANHGLSLAEIDRFLSKFKIRPGGQDKAYELDLVKRAFEVRPRFAF
jgi:hypothetical protein